MSSAPSISRQQGSITYRGQAFERMNPLRAARMGIARTFQSLALFKGMSVLDNFDGGSQFADARRILAQALRIGRPSARR